LRVQLPPSILLLFLITPVLPGIALMGPTLPRLPGVALLAAFVLGMGALVWLSRGRDLFESEALEEVEREGPSRLKSVLLTLVGLVAIAAGGELVAKGAEGLIRGFAIPPLLMGMVIAPAAIELEEVVRQAVPTRQGRPEIAAGNLVGTLLYFVLFNLGLIAVATPVSVQPIVRTFDWPFSIGVTALATLFLWLGGVNRWQGVVLLLAYVGFVTGHVLIGP
jgi:cation:H+ antiporter